MKRVFLLAGILFLGAGCAAPSAVPSGEPTPVSIQDKQSFVNDTFNYEFVAPKASQVSTPQNFVAGGGASQQRVIVYIGADANISVDVHLKGQSATYDEAKIASDPAFKKIEIDGREMWQSKPSSTFSTTVLFGPQYIYELQFSSLTASPENQEKLDTFLKGFRVTE